MTKPSFVIKGGTVIDVNGARRADIAVDDGVVALVAEEIEVIGVPAIDANGLIVCPGLVDIHTHVREPGDEDAETIETASRAAVLGGYTAIVAMPNTTPAIDSAKVVKQVRKFAEKALCEVGIAAAITKNRAGEKLTNFAELAEAGVQLFTDDGSGVQDDELMRHAFEVARPLGITLAQHCEMATLSRGGVMNESELASQLGLVGIPTEAEEMMVMRDIALARMTGGRIHFLHLSTAMSVAMVRTAKRQGLNVTAEAAPHHFTLTQRELADANPIYKVNPPLRSDRDLVSVRNGLADGAIDAIATDHAPHTPESKALPLEKAPPGMLGLQTALALSLDLARPSDSGPAMSVTNVIGALSWHPARIAHLEDHGGPIEPGRPANLTIIDPEAQWVVDGAQFASKASNTPYQGRKLTGKVRDTFFRGEQTVKNGEPTR